MARLRPPISASAPGLFLALAALVSVGVHVGGVMAAGERSLGKLNGSALKDPPPSLAVERVADDWLPKAASLTAPIAPEDVILPEQAEPPLNTETTAPELDANTPDPSELQHPPQDLTALSPAAPPDLTLTDLPPAPLDNPSSQDLLAALDAVDLEGLALHQTPAPQPLPLPELIDLGQGGHTGTTQTPPPQDLLNDPQLIGPPMDAIQPGLDPSLSAPENLLAPQPIQTQDTQAILHPQLPVFTPPPLEDALSTQTDWLPPIQLDDAFDYNVQHHLAPQAPHYFTARITPRPKELQLLDPMPKDVIFLLDTSSSIAKSIVREVFAGVSRGLGTLNNGDRFNIAVFSRETIMFNRSLWIPATPQNKINAKAFLNRITPGGSHTDVNQALSSLLAQAQKDPSRVLNVVIVSDGKPTQGVTNSKDLINQITANNNRIASVYCVAVTRNPNTFLLDYLAYRNGGRSLVATDTDDVANTIATLCSQLRYPLIRDVSLSIVGSGARDVHPIALADIHQGQPFSIYGRFDVQGPFTIRIAGSGLKDGRVQPVDFTFVRDLRVSRQGPKTIKDEWAFWKLHHLYSEQIRLGESRPLRDEIRTLEKVTRRRR